ncbi:hypothetical protein NX773_02325 [Massilia solisilvae]|uniref:Holin n=1 Tax=Massilia solisilvae TaxID=1811225 RepID=A0ABT2BEQ2_9BURK|nr:hypothetical protein [Massilia solisilvae]MCS0606999.1 hypothetical protein [Massilia solisilvae]
MKVKLQLYSSMHSRHASELVSGACRRLNRVLAPFGAASLLVGVVASATDQDAVADYAVATGLLCYLIAWFDNWWEKARR